MIATLMAMAHNTAHKGKYSHDYAVRATRARNHGIVNPLKAVSCEERRWEWVTYRNLNDWVDFAKKELVDIGFAKDEPGLIREISFIRCDYLFLLSASNTNLTPTDGIISEILL